MIKMWMIYDDLRFAIDQIPFRLYSPIPFKIHGICIIESFCMILPYLHTSVTVTGCGSLSNGHEWPWPWPEVSSEDMDLVSAEIQAMQDV